MERKSKSMAVTITNSLVTELNQEQTLTMNAATSSVINETEVFTYTPTGKDSKIIIGIQVATGHGAVAYSIANGVGVFAKGAETGSVAAASTEFLQPETGRFMSATGTILITFTPASGKRLLTDHALNVWVIELL